MKLRPGFFFSMLEEHFKGLDEKKLLEDWKPGENEEIVREYWIYKPILKVVITVNKETSEKAYIVVEPMLVEEEVQLLDEIYKDIEDILILKDLTADPETKANILFKTYQEIISEYGIKISDVLNVKYLYYLLRDFLGVGIIEPIMDDPYIEDIHCDGYDIPVYVYHKEFGNIKTNIKFSREALDKYVQTLVQICDKHISHGNPIIDATMPDGSRLQATYGMDITPRGSSFTIRKFSEDPLTPIDLLSLGTYTAEQLAYFWMVVENKLSTMIIGETASGKTTTLNALLMFVPPEAKIVSIEDTREIALMHENWVAEVTRQSIGEEEKEIDMYDLLRTSLRQRPDYIVVGEVRGKEAQTLFQAMSTGHAAYATLHAGDIQQAIYRLENAPLNVPRSMIQFLDVIVVQIRWTKGGVKKRRARGIYEVLGIDPTDKNLLINEVYVWDPYSDTYMLSGVMKKLEKIAMVSGDELDVTIKELRRREAFLKKLQELGVRNYKDVTSMIHAYYRNPNVEIEEIISETLNRIKAEKKRFKEFGKIQVSTYY
jgi:flagellar protein FlaI